MIARSLMMLAAGFSLNLPASLMAAQGPASRAAVFARLPDWTGIWETEAAVTLRSTGRLQPPQLWSAPPYNAEWQGRSARPGGAPSSATDLPPTIKACEPAGFPASMEHPVPDLLFELLVTPEQTLLVLTNGEVRHIHTDGRRHPDRDDLWPTPEGDSIGHWEGDTLVVDTVARKAGRVGPPMPGIADLSEQAHFTERLRRLDADTMENILTIDDPQRFSRPWQITIRYKRAKDVQRMIAVDCRENDRNPVVDGRFIIAPPVEHHPQ